MAERARTHSFEATSEGISAADAWVEQVGQELAFTERQVFGARLCVAEIAANVHEHGGRFAEPARMSLSVRREGRSLEMEITDSGRPFDPTSVPDIPRSQTIEAAPIGGLGLHLVRSYASAMRYHHDGDRNHVVLQIPDAAGQSSSDVARGHDPASTG